MEFCMGMQETEEEVDKFLEENPNFLQDDPLEFNINERQNDGQKD